MSVVEYFEKGCLCVLTGRIEKVKADHPNPEQYYVDNCTCTRHPESGSRECWDNDKELRLAAIQQIKGQELV